MKYYLDDEGLGKLWARIQRLVYECGGKGGSGCNCESLTNADIDSVTPIKCKESDEVCPQESLGQLAYRFTDTARGLSPQ